jgi:Uma2 family endonuclease
LSEDRHPGTAVLVIEVAGDSLRKDRRVKAALYARFGIPEYRIVIVGGTRRRGALRS